MPTGTPGIPPNNNDHNNNDHDDDTNNGVGGAHRITPITPAGHWIPGYSPNPFSGDSESRWTGEVTWVVPSVPDMDRPAPIRVKVDTGQIRRRLSRIDGATRSGEVWADYWLDVLEAVAEIPALLDAVDQLVSAWKGERRRYADLLAAGKATLSAHAEGENDPLSYLRDEIDHDSNNRDNDNRESDGPRGDEGGRR